MSAVMESKGKMNKKMLIIGGAATAVLLALGGGGYYMLSAPIDSGVESVGVENVKKSNATTPVISEVEDKSKFSPPRFLTLQPLVVNLAAPDQGRYLQVEAVYELKDEDTLDAMRQILPTIRSRSLMILGSKTINDLRDPNAKKVIADEMVEMAKYTFDEVGGGFASKVKNVHFSSFVIQ